MASNPAALEADDQSIQHEEATAAEDEIKLTPRAKALARREREHSEKLTLGPNIVVVRNCVSETSPRESVSTAARPGEQPKLPEEEEAEQPGVEVEEAAGEAHVAQEACTPRRLSMPSPILRRAPDLVVRPGWSTDRVRI